VGSEPLAITGSNPPFEMLFLQRDAGYSDHVPGIVVQVVADAKSIDDAPDQFRTLLAQQLDVLSFVTHSAFVPDER